MPSDPYADLRAAQNPKLTLDEWIAHSRKHRWRFDLPHEETGVATEAPIAEPAAAAVPTNEQIDAIRQKFRQGYRSGDVTDGYVQRVPDKCDRIVWRNIYYHLPLEEPVQAAPEGMAGLRSALERLVWSYELLLAGKPVRDAAETLAEARAALSASQGGKS